MSARSLGPILIVVKERVLPKGISSYVRSVSDLSCDDQHVRAPSEAMYSGV